MWNLIMYCRWSKFATRRGIWDKETQTTRRTQEWLQEIQGRGKTQWQNQFKHNRNLYIDPESLFLSIFVFLAERSLGWWGHPHCSREKTNTQGTLLGFPHFVPLYLTYSMLILYIIMFNAMSVTLFKHYYCITMITTWHNGVFDTTQLPTIQILRNYFIRKAT